MPRSAGADPGLCRGLCPGAADLLPSQHRCPMGATGDLQHCPAPGPRGAPLRQLCAPLEPAAGEALPAAPTTRPGTCVVAQPWPTCGHRGAQFCLKSASAYPPASARPLLWREQTGRARWVLRLLRRNTEKVGCRRYGEEPGVPGERQAAAHLPTTGYRGVSSRHLSSAPHLLQEYQTLLTATNTA